MIGAPERDESSAPDERRRYLSHSEITIGPRDHLVIAGILRSGSRADLEPDAAVVPLLPHDALLVLERTDPDLVLVESGAVAAGYPWAGAGEPGVADVSRRLLEVLDAAHRLGRPTVLWWSGPRHAAPGLIPFETHFDVLLASDATASDSAAPWSPGVQLARFSPIGAGPDRTHRPVAHLRSEAPTERTSRSFIAAVLRGLDAERLEVWSYADDVGAMDWLPASFDGRRPRRVVDDELPDLYRSARTFIADPMTDKRPRACVPTSALRQLATGAFVVSGPAPSLTERLAEWVEQAADPDGVRSLVDPGRAVAGRSTWDLRRLLRALFLDHDTTLAVRTLARLAGIRAPTPRRGCAVVARIDEEARPERFVDSVVLQQYRPTEAFISVADNGDLEVVTRELESLRIAVHAECRPQAGRGLVRWTASQAEAAWLWTWSPRIAHDPTYLLDAVIAGVMTGASIVGAVPGSDDGFSADDVSAGRVLRRADAARLPEPGPDHQREWTVRGATAYGLASAPDGR